MSTAARTTARAFVVATLAVACARPAAAETGYDLWLRYRPLTDPQRLAAARQHAAAIVGVDEPSEIRRSAIAELQRGLSGLLDRSVPLSNAITTDGAIVIGTARSPIIASLGWRETLDRLGGEGYVIRATSVQDKAVTVVASAGDAGLLYGAFHLLRVLQTGDSIAGIDIAERPQLQRRLLNHWDNLDGTIERGYAGLSLWWGDGQVEPASRIEDYARANASIGINGAVINNVNANPNLMTPAYLEKAAALAGTLRRYGIRVYMSANAAAPRMLGELATADPLDPAVAKWWREKVDAIYARIPDFGGFVVKANSEGQPGPQDYGRTHADGANVLADALQPHGGVVMWRAFVYDPEVDQDRIKRAYLEFVPLDGRFRSNVFVQVKNGPLDFQPREPFHPLFGAMPKTPLMAELQITQEYLGHSNHLVYLAPMWKEFLLSDTFAAGQGSTVAKVVDGSMTGLSSNGIAGVANTGRDLNWTGHHFGQANWYAYGRLAWNPSLDEGAIADEWIRMTWGHAGDVVATIRSLMLDSRETFVRYTMPLGLHHLIGGDHYAPMPENADPRRIDWTALYYHRADASGVGFNRTTSGSNAVGQYRSPLREHWNDPAATPDTLLLWFHRLPWTHRMRSGTTLWDAIVRTYAQGASEARAFEGRWRRLQGRVDDERYEAVRLKLHRQADDAAAWAEKCIRYFQQFSGMPVTDLRADAALKTLVPGTLIGVALNQHQSDGDDPIARGIVAQHVNAITPENLLKWSRVHPEPDRYAFDPADRYVSQGERAGMFIVGHTLVWHQQTPDWVFTRPDGGPLDREMLLARMREHIQTVVGRYRGRIHAWDVVNEALNEDGSWRQTPWFTIIGEDYVAKAFEFAREADPEAELYYNDFNLWKPAKRDAALTLVAALRERGLKVDGVGEQGHWLIDAPPIDEIEFTITAVRAAGVKAMITELDVDVLPRRDPEADVPVRGDATALENPYETGIPDDVQRALAQRYADIFALFARRSADLARITFWGVTDATSWLNNWPLRGRTNHPLLWDRDGRPKPAFASVVEALWRARAGSGLD
jgi:alpha-glucuronidase